MLVTLIFAIAEMIVIVSGGIDVSFPAVACISLYGTLKIMLALNIDSLLFAYILAALIGTAFGLVNAILIAKFRILPLIATLGVSSAVNGWTLAVLGTKEISNIPTNVDKLSQMFFILHIPIPTALNIP
jgi:simple sugar transport system permease protein